ncbi:hypothetical protein B9Z55_023175 [Caenorhabditis nigoni]|uniref:Uncharacterized protein n=1 Tax=Caenorhabditis nigoni TaxID=1611254 RepID=A0A2G5SP32_9PELO|nr:hypothetical protein B9Z55_023175 [Caenorhabditis nigoni]
MNWEKLKTSPCDNRLLFAWRGLAKLSKWSSRSDFFCEKEEWGQRKAQLLKGFLEQLKKGFFHTREDGEPANKAPRAANGRENE